MNSDLYRKLVDLYADHELPSELEEQMQLAAESDAGLREDMNSLRRTVERIRAEKSVEFTEESYQRVLMKLYARGAQPATRAPEPAHLQYHLPMQG